MSSFEKLVYDLQMTMERPVAFGWFHLMWIGLVVISIFVLFLLRGKYSDKQLKRVLLVYGIIAFILELTKQVIWSFNYDPFTMTKYWDYQWYSAPFQLCTMPIYISIIAAFLKKGKIRKSLLSFIAFYTILGSIATIIMPSSCFVETTLVNIHTMWLHCGSFVVSIYLLITNEVEISFKNLKLGFIIFIISIFIALLLDIILFKSGVIGSETFNMFYISPYFISTLPIFDVIQQSVPYFIFLLIYILVCTFGAVIIFMISKMIKKLYKYIKNKSE